MKTAQSAKSSKGAKASQHAPFCAEINHWNKTPRLLQHHFGPPPIGTPENALDVSFLRTKKSRAKGPVGQLPPKPNKGHRRVCAEECCDVHSRDCTWGSLKKALLRTERYLWYHTVDGRIRRSPVDMVVYPIIYRVSYMSGAEFLDSINSIYSTNI